MPLYEYHCTKCEALFERIQKFSDPPEAECPECGGPSERQLSAPAIQFKGSGWYITDYARKSSGDGKGKESDGEKSGAKEGGGDTKSAGKGKSETKGSGKSDAKTPASASKKSG